MKYYRSMAVDKIQSAMTSDDFDKCQKANDLMSQVSSLDIIDAEDGAYQFIYDEACSL
jgi:hypothetical protein